MSKNEKKVLVKSLQMFLDESEQMWKDGKPHAQIVGFLQGTIKGAMVQLEGLINKIKFDQLGK